MQRGTLIAVVRAGRDVPLCAFSNRLALTIATHDPVVHLSRPNIPGDGRRNGVSEALGDREAHGYVLCECEDVHSSWSRECIRLADCILWLSGDLSADPVALSPEGVEDAKPGHRKELVLIHRDRQAYSGTLRQAEVGQFDLHHHVALDSDEDFARLARLLTGRGVALVLGGGGARGFAHIGVIRALRVSKVPIDLIGGTGMGACIGAQCALGWDYETMLEKNRQAWIRLRPLRGYTIPLVSLLTGKRLMRALAALFGDTQIEDLGTNFFCVSSDLVRGEAVVHRQGSLRKYLRATSSVPGIVPPVPDHGSLLVDGGVLNNVPADVMRRLYRGAIIAVDVNPYAFHATLVSQDYGESLSGWQILWSRLNPFGRKLRVPSIQTILERATRLGGIRQSNELLHGSGDLYIRPATDEFGVFEMNKLDTIADLGYRFAAVEIEAWKESSNRLIQEQRRSTTA